MARVTVEDCVLVVPNRFELCLIANNRAKSILSGAPTSLDAKEKPSVIALREIADGLINIDRIRQNIIESTKNRGFNANNIDDSVKEETSQAIAEESENNMPLKDNIFLEDNLAIED